MYLLCAGSGLKVPGRTLPYRHLVARAGPHLEDRYLEAAAPQPGMQTHRFLAARALKGDESEPLGRLRVGGESPTMRETRVNLDQ